MRHIASSAGEPGGSPRRGPARAPLLALLAGTAVVLGACGDDARTTQVNAEAPVAPKGVPATAACVSDAPGQGVEEREGRTVQLPLPDPSHWRPESPQRAVAEFMDAWHDRAWDRMATWTARSWQEITPGDEGAALRDRYGTYRLRGWTFTGNPKRGARSVRLQVLEAHRDLAPRITRERLRFVVNRENAAGELVDRGGRWGVFLSERPDAQNDCPGS